MEAWQKVLVDPKFLDDVHSKPGCIACHGGTPDVDDKAAAHQGLLKRASLEPDRTCGSCHVGIVEQAQNSAHRLLPGYLTVMSQRGADFTRPETVKAYTNHCTSCHATCADCHITRPYALDGGLLAGHQVKRVASVFTTCGGCHSARIADEYRGAHEGIPADVHWQKAGMPCTRCHTMQEFHDGAHGTRYDTEPSMDCVDCHQNVGQTDSDNVQHQVHLETVQCQVCHSAGAYKSCFNCHTGVDDKGITYYTTDPSRLTFKIGRNPIQSDSRPWKYVLVRHAPATPGLWEYYGENLLPGFDNLPTWKYTTPHNIQKITPQNATCNNCHGQEQLFLTAADVAPELLNANRNVIVTEIPAEIRRPPAEVKP